MSTHTGTTITDLGDLVARVDNTLALLKADPWALISKARIHLADKSMDEGDVQAWILLGKFQDAFLSGKTAECRNCGEMEGMHYLYGLYCRDQRDRGIFSSALVSYRFEAK